MIRIPVLTRRIVLISGLGLLLGCSTRLPPEVRAEIGLLKRIGYESRPELSPEIGILLEDYVKNISKYEWVGSGRNYFFEHPDRGWAVFIYNPKSSNTVEFVKLKINNGSIYEMYGVISEGEKNPSK